MSRSTNELRVLTGIHAGARAPLPDGEATIGTAGSCDFILSDEGVQPQHARLLPEGDGWTVHWLQDAGAPPVRLAPGAGLSIGPVLVTLDAANAPWPDKLPTPRDEPAEMHSREPEATQSPDQTPAPAAGQPIDPPMADGSARRLPWILVAPVVAAVVVTALALAWALFSPRAARIAPAPARPPIDANAAQQRVARTVGELGFGQRVSVESDGNGGSVVRAILVSDEEAEALASAVSQLSPRPLLQIVTESDLRQSVAEAVERHAAQLQVSLSAKYLGDGRFRIDGQLPGQSERDSLLSNLRAQFPQVRTFESGLLTPESAAERMVADLQAAGIAQVRGQWRDGKLWLDVRLAESDIPRWEQALARTATRHSLPFSAQMELLPVPPAGTANAILPFRLHSVISGNTPYVVLADGTKLLTGGSHLGWQLVEVAPQRVVFEGSGARRVELAR